MSARPSVANISKLNDFSSGEESEALPRHFEHYLLLKQMARGGMGEVYLATSAGAIEGAERPCVVKVIRREHSEDGSFLARFLDEARIQAQLEHPGVVRVLEASRDGAGKPYVVLEHVEGRNMSELRLRAQQLSTRIGWADAVAIGMGMLDALSHVHERTDSNGKPLDIVHRDLSPQNVMVGYGGDIKVIDFGTARGQNRRCHTVAGIVFAKPGYVAPEVANNNPGGVPADLYAVGVMLWELVAGRRFLQGDSNEHMAAVGAGTRLPARIAELVDAPAELDEIITRLTATLVTERYGSAREGLSELAQLLKRAPSMSDGQRGVRTRVSQLMQRLYPAEPTRTRAEFTRLLAAAKQTVVPASALIPEPSPAPSDVESSESEGLLAGTRYRLVRELGAGTGGVVHEALHIDLGRSVALKLLSEDVTCEGPRLEAFRREARTIARLEHENIVRLYDFGICGSGRAFFAMELLDGASLEVRLTDGPLEWRSAFALGVQACRALEAAHAAGIVHRDIKPANLFVTRSGALKLLDFGVAGLGGVSESSDAPGEAFVLSGTPEYMAPEQARGQAPSDASDVYSLGVVLYEMVTGQLPHVSDGIPQLLEQKLHLAAVPPARRARELRLPRRVDQVVMKALQVSLDERFASATQLREALESALDHAAEQNHRGTRRSARWLGGSLALLSVLALGSVGRTGVEVKLGSLVQQARAGWEAQLAPTPELRRSLPATQSRAGAAVAQLTSEQPAVQAVAIAPTPVPEAPAVASDELETSLARINSWLASGKEVRALHELRKLGPQHPSDERVLAAWSRAAERTHAYGEAERLAQRRVTQLPSVEAKLELARLARVTGHVELARQVLSELLRDEPERGDVREALAHLDAGKSERSARVARR